MALADTIKSVEENVGKVWDKIEEVGGTVPASKNIANMVGSINSMTQVFPNYAIFTIGEETLCSGAGTKAFGNPVQSWQDAFTVGNALNSSSAHFSFRTNGGSSITLNKTALLHIRLDYGGQFTTSTGGSFLLGGNESRYGFTNLEYAEIQNTPTLPQYFGSYSFTKNAKIVLGEGITQFNGFCFNYTNFGGILELPSTLTDVGAYFLFGAPNIKGVYIPAGCPPPTDTPYALGIADATAPAVVNGITLYGPGAAAWKAALPDLSGVINRKLILDPEWA